MKKYTKQDIIQLVEENDVQFIRLQFTDVFGALKNVAIPTSQLERALDNKCMFDGSSIEGFVRIEESDMYLYPDLNTFEILPWRPQHGRVARLYIYTRLVFLFLYLNMLRAAVAQGNSVLAEIESALLLKSGAAVYLPQHLFCDLI